MVDWTLELIRNNAALAYLVVAAVCFAESFAFVSLLVPGWAFMVAAGALVGAGKLSFLPVAAAGALGAALGDAVSYWIGWRFKKYVPRMWPFTRHPDWLERGHEFFRRWGAMSVAIGRFFGPIRAVIPLAAGMMEMPARPFWIANVGSALVWAPALAAQGALVGWGLKEIQWNDPLTQIGLWTAVALGVVAFVLYRRWSA
ncbi:MAG: DedA family protein [Rhodospirillales bacterium]